MFRNPLRAALVAAAFAGCSSTPPPNPPPPASSVALSVSAQGVPGVVYDLHQYEQSPTDARTFTEVATQLNQAPTAADGSLTASLPCNVLGAGAVGRIDVIAHLPTMDGAIADAVLKDFSEIDPADLANAVGEQMKFVRQSRPFVCASGQAVPVSLALEVSQRKDLAQDYSDMTLPLHDSTVAMAVAPNGAGSVATDLSITAPTAGALPEIYAFGFSSASLSALTTTDSTSGTPTRTFHAGWTLPPAGTAYSLTLFATTFDATAASPLTLGGNMYVWGTSAQADGSNKFAMVDGFRVIAAGKVTDGASTNAGLLINCETANVPNYTGTGINLVYSKGADAKNINPVVPIYYLHLVAQRPVPSQAIGAIDLGGGEFGLILHEVANPQTVFTAKCGFARPDPAGGLTGGCDETAPGSGVLVEHSLAELLTH